MANPLETSHTTDEEEVFGTLKLAELREAFRALSRENLGNLKICFFVDGLDEFVGLGVAARYFILVRRVYRKIFHIENGVIITT